MSDNNNIISAIAEKIVAVIQDKLEPAVKEKVGKNQYFSVAEVCAMLKISKATFYRHKNLGYITPASYVGRKPLFTQQSVDDYLAHFC